jgi:hypothetical protein
MGSKVTPPRPDFRRLREAGQVLGRWALRTASDPRVLLALRSTWVSGRALWEDLPDPRKRGKSTARRAREVFRSLLKTLQVITDVSLEKWESLDTPGSEPMVEVPVERRESPRRTVPSRRKGTRDLRSPPASRRP